MIVPFSKLGCVSFRWSEKKFPHEEFDLAKNETIKLLEYIRVNVVQLYTKVFAEGKVLYNRVRFHIDIFVSSQNL